MFFLFIKSFINIFAAGISDAKAFLFLIFAASVFMYFLWLKYKKRSRSLFTKNYFLLSSGILYLYGLFLSLYLFLFYKIPLGNYILVGGFGEISTTVFFHNHLLKGSLGQFFHYLGKLNFINMDAGGAYIGLLPEIFFGIGFVLIVAVILQIIPFFHSLYVSLYGKKKRQKFFSVLGFAIAVFSLVKTAIDGGLLSAEAILSFIFLILLTQQKRVIDKKSFHYTVLFCSVVLVVSFFLLRTTLYSAELISFAAIFPLYGVILYGIKDNIKITFLISFMLVFICGWWLFSSSDRALHNYANLQLSEGTEYIWFDLEDTTVKKSLTESNMTILDLSQDLNKNISYYGISVPGRTCNNEFSYKRFFTVVSPHKYIQEDVSSSYYDISMSHQEKDIYGWWKTELVFSPSDCVPEYLSVINSLLIKGGLDTYIIKQMSLRYD